MHFYLIIILSYILGSIPFGKIVGNFKGLDIQKQGSGNIGFANSLRVMGWKPALIVLLGDTMKGYIPVFYAVDKFSLTKTLVIGLFAVAGHIFNPWLKFKGGKGVATMVGISLALNPLIALIAMTTWGVLFLLGKIASISSLVIALLMPILSLFLEPKLFYFYFFLLVIILLTHRINICNLLKDKEEKVF
jgi:glycerol-3-phosphate acyltransferase PlsY